MRIRTLRTCKDVTYTPYVRESSFLLMYMYAHAHTRIRVGKTSLKSLYVLRAFDWSGFNDKDMGADVLT